MNFSTYLNSLEPFSLDELSKFPGFNSKLYYAKTRLKQIASGSSRTVFEYNNDVIKIAKNKKGLEQNKIEIEIGLTETKLVAELKQNDSEFYWSVFKKANQLNSDKFESLTNFKMSEIHTYLKYTKDKLRYNIALESDKEQYIKENEIIFNLTKLVEEYNLSVGDMIRLSSWGEIDNSPVLIDFGLTSEIYKKYYK